MQPLYRVSPSAECLYRDKTSKTVVGDRLIVAGHQLLRCGHSSAHTEARAWNVGVSGRYAVHTVKVLVAGCWRLIFQVELIFALKLFLVDVLNKLAVRTRLVGTTMSDLH